MIPPDFLVIGAYKSGTTALHHYLRAHPQLFVPDRKEPNYYAFAGCTPPFQHPAAAQSVRDESTYAALFSRAPAGRLRGEVSPAYLAVPEASERIAREAPGVKLIAILRNPIERAYSDFLMYRRDGLEREASFVRALEQQPLRSAHDDPTAHYISTGRYAEQLDRYGRHFPHEQIHVLLHEDLRDRREQTLADLFAFLGVDDGVEIEDQEASNVSGEPPNALVRLAYTARRRARVLRPLVPEGLRRRADARLQQQLTRPPLPAEAAEVLIETYRADITQLADMIERDLSGWLELRPQG